MNALKKSIIGKIKETCYKIVGGIVTCSIKIILWKTFTILWAALIVCIVYNSLFAIWQKTDVPSRSSKTHFTECQWFLSSEELNYLRNTESNAWFTQVFFLIYLSDLNDQWFYCYFITIQETNIFIWKIALFFEFIIFKQRVFIPQIETCLR